METEQLQLLWQLAFGDSPEFIRLFFGTAYAPERCRFLTVDGQIAAALYWFDTTFQEQKLAYLYAVATHPGHRGKGLCRELIAQTHRQLSNEGYAGALLVPGETQLRQMYKKIGYRDCTSLSEISCAAGAPVAIRPVDISEYAKLRQRYLPRDGVVQEGENLRYLATFASLYAGDDFVLAAATDSGSLQGLELLGNRDAAPGILSALGYDTGRFRIPGQDIPFAMFHPLRGDATAPGYFGLAFD